MMRETGTGPRSLIFSTTARWLSRLVTRTRVPSGRSRWAAVRPYMSNGWPLVVSLPWNRGPYQLAMPTWYGVGASVGGGAATGPGTKLGPWEATGAATRARVRSKSAQSRCIGGRVLSGESSVRATVRARSGSWMSLLYPSRRRVASRQLPVARGGVAAENASHAQAHWHCPGVDRARLYGGAAAADGAGSSLAEEADSGAECARVSTGVLGGVCVLARPPAGVVRSQRGEVVYACFQRQAVYAGGGAAVARPGFPVPYRSAVHRRARRLGRDPWRFGADRGGRPELFRPAISLPVGSRRAGVALRSAVGAAKAGRRTGGQGGEAHHRRCGGG